MQSDFHRTKKAETGDFLHRVGFSLIFFEKRYCDVLAVKRINGRQYTLGAEIEFSVRNLLRNIQRNLQTLGCDGVLVIVPDFQVLGEVARKLSRELAPEFRNKVGVATFRTLQLLSPEIT